MTLLIPLGLLGLLSIVALIVIYIIKPNYQHKEVTSSYVWKLSLKYRKKRLPTSKLRNILLIVCQVLALIAGVLIMSKPVVRSRSGALDSEAIIIIDASASMRTKNDDGVTRFERAVNGAIDLANDVIAKGGYVSVILSDVTGTSYLMRKAGISSRDALNEGLRGLITGGDETACSYAATDLNAAITLCEEVLISNPNASVHLFTDSDYTYVPKGITVKNVAEKSEWNVGILNVYTEFEEGYYTFFVEIGCYGGVARKIDLSVSINDANEIDENTGKGSFVRFSAKDVLLRDNAVTTVVFRNSKITIADYEQATESIVIVPVGQDVIGTDNKTLVFAYRDAHFTIDEEDGLELDNTYSLYGGRKQQLKIQYATIKRKSFFTAMFGVLRTRYADRWELVVDEVDISARETPETMGYDFYVFENFVPNQLPQDGVVFLSNPDSLPAGLTKKDQIIYNKEMYLAQDNDHAILKNTDAAKIWTRKLTRLSQYNDAIYTSLWSVDANPVLLINDGELEKVIVFLFDIEWSNVPLRNDFPFFLYNIFETFLPATVVGNSFEVGQQIKVNSRGYSLKVSRNAGNDETIVTALPSHITLDKPDTYRFSQQNYFGAQLPDTYIFVKIPAAESNVAANGIALKTIYNENVKEKAYYDLLVFWAAAMLALLFAEWFLQSQESL